MAPAERMLKLGVWAGFALPDLGDAAEPDEARRTEAVYYDTPGLRLLRHGVTLHGGDGGWAVERPDGPSLAGAFEELRALTLGYALGEPLVPAAKLVTARRTIALADGAAIADDDIAVLRGKRVAARFRELELRAGSKRQLERLAAKLRDAGAQPVDRVPKLVRALGPAAVAPEVEADAETAAGAVSARLARALGR